MSQEHTTPRAKKSESSVIPHPVSSGDIKINLSVVASIVRLAALRVEGVVGVGGSFVDGIAEIFSKKESERGVRVSELDSGQYLIEVRVILQFGVELARVAEEVQEAVRNQVLKMTNKHVARVDVVIDGIKVKNESKGTHKDAWDDEDTGAPLRGGPHAID